MKGTTALAIGICIVCFLIGYLTYLGLMIFVDFFVGEANPCRNTIEVCSQQQTSHRGN